MSTGRALGRCGRAAWLAAAALAGCAATGPARPASPPVAAPAPAAAGDRFARGEAVLGRLDPAAPRRVMEAYAGVAPDFDYVIPRCP
ncbi:hypothetical protein [Sorangium sp. So ce542]|uniref:hypothetical protein n=1 Tax=Sorangium sp. So ce542 TaxID=3133316 RepID=UPI003F603129